MKGSWNLQVIGMSYMLSMAATEVGMYGMAVSNTHGNVSPPAETLTMEGHHHETVF